MFSILEYIIAEETCRICDNKGLINNACDRRQTIEIQPKFLTNAMTLNALTVALLYKNPYLFFYNDVKPFVSAFFISLI